MNLDQDKNCQAMLMSGTLLKLQQLSEKLPIDINKAEELKMAFSTTSVELIKALDANRIKFSLDSDCAMFHALLVVVVDYAMDGRLRYAGKKSSVN
jgi:hypothetical protein